MSKETTIVEAATIPDTVTLLTFDGWGAAIDIIRWLADRGHRAYYVPQGFEHGLRFDIERDRSRGDILDSAAPFLVVAQIACAEQRVDWGDVIAYRQGDLSIHSGTEATQLFRIKGGS